MSKMKSYLDRLSDLSPDQTLLTSDCLVLFLSGSSDYTCAGLLSASLANIVYYRHTVLNPCFQELLQLHMSPLLETQEVIVVCKSSGVNMLTQWLNHLDNEISLPRFRIIALGPVSQKLLDNKKLEVLVIKGKKDPYSQFLDSHQADILVDTDHYSYEYKEDVKGIIYDWIRQSDKNRCDKRSI